VSRVRIRRCRDDRRVSTISCARPKVLPAPDRRHAPRRARPRRRRDPAGIEHKLGKYAEEKLAKRGVEIHLNTKVSEVNGNEVVLSNGIKIITNSMIWTAGTSPNPMLDTLPCDKDRGKLCADEFMEVNGFPGVWAVGDCASINDPKTGKPYPPTAQHAIRQGKVLAHNITAAVRGGKKKPFAFETIASSPPSAAVRASLRYWELISQALSPGGCGDDLSDEAAAI